MRDFRDRASMEPDEMLFSCKFCKSQVIFSSEDEKEPVTGSGSCFVCGSNQWVILNNKGEIIE